MTNSRTIATMVAIAFLAGGLSVEAFAVATGTSSATRQLAKLLHKDVNGVVSRDEFVQYMGNTYDHLDSDGNGQLTVAQLAPVTSSNWLKCESLAMERGVLVTERAGHRPGETGPTPWKQSMDSCLAGKIH